MIKAVIDIPKTKYLTQTIFIMHTQNMRRGIGTDIWERGAKPLVQTQDVLHQEMELMFLNWWTKIMDIGDFDTKHFADCNKTNGEV